MSDVLLTPHQQSVFDNIIDSIDESIGMGQKFMGSLTGPAGTGKTVMTAEIVKTLLTRYSEKHLRIATPTHMSLRVLREFVSKSIKKHRNFSSSTIHSYLKLKIEMIEDKIIFVEDFSSTKKPDPTRILIIDESSMISDELFKHIKTKSQIAGLDAVLFVGDKVQLPPVDGKSNPIYDEIQQFQLSEVVRQAWDNPVLKKATEIRKCIESKNFDKNLLNFDEFNETSNGIKVYHDIQEWLKYYLTDKDNKTLSSYTNNSVNSYNNFVRKMVNGSTSLPMLIDGEEIVLQETFENDGKFVSNGETLTVCSPVLNYHKALKLNYWTFTPNDDDDLAIEIRIVDNDSISRFHSLLEQISSRAKKHKYNKEYKESKEMWEKFWEVKKMFVDIKYNFAHTIHKLQGNSVNNVYFNLNETINNCPDSEMLFRLVYVALTRARKEAIILV